MSFQAVTIDNSNRIRERMIEIFANTTYTSDLFTNTSQIDQTDTFIVERKPLQSSSILKRYPALAVFDSTMIDYKLSKMNYVRGQYETMYIQVVDRSTEWEDAKDTTRLICKNIIRLLEYSNNLSSEGSIASGEYGFISSMGVLKMRPGLMIDRVTDKESDTRRTQVIEVHKNSNVYSITLTLFFKYDERLCLNF